MANDPLARTTEFLELIRENDVAGLGPMKGWDDPFEFITKVRQSIADADIRMTLDDGSPTTLLIAAARLIRAAELIEGGRGS